MDAILIGKTAKSRERQGKIKTIIQTILKANVHTYSKTSTIESLKPEVDRNWNK